MKIALVGYGKMGKTIEALAVEQGLQIGPIFDVHNIGSKEGLEPENLRGVDAAIEFSTPQTTVDNMKRLVELGIPTVVGTTGWDSRRDEVRLWVERHEGALVFSANYSIGVQLLLRLVRRGAELFASQPDYRPYILEAHHDQKKDAPSGTARALEEVLKTRYAEVPVSSLRAGFIPGTHEVGWDSAFDTVTLIHRARDRRVFASGALAAARWVAGKRGFYAFEDILEQVHGK